MSDADFNWSRKDAKNVNILKTSKTENLWLDFVWRQFYVSDFKFGNEVASAVRCPPWESLRTGEA